LRFDNPKDPVSFNGIPGNTCKASYEIERDLALKGGFSNFGEDLTYGVTNDFQMELRPFFKSKGAGYGTDQLNENQIRSQVQRKMELFTGSANNPDYRPRTERAPLFKPVKGLTNIYGSPVMTDFYETRYIPSKERRNELPFEQTRVTPGLNLGHNEVNQQGYHDMTRILPKTVDELRTANRPKVSYEGVIIPGMKGNKGPVKPNIAKRKPMTFSEQGTEWLIKGVGEQKAPSIKGQINQDTLATMNRGTREKGYVGPAKADIEKATSQNLQEQFQQSNRQNYLADGPRNVTVNESHKARGFDENYNPKMTERMNKNNYIGPLGNTQYDKDIIHNYLEIPEMTMRAVHVNMNRVGTVGGTLHKNIAFNPNDIPDETQRDIYSMNDRVGPVRSYEYDREKAHNLYDIPDLTLRDIHGKSDRTGQMSPQFHKHQANNLYDIPHLTMRDIHGQTDRTGQINLQSEQIRNYNLDAPDLNMRNIHDKFDRSGQLGTQQMNRSTAYNYNDIPDMTMRNIHDRADRSGMIGNQQMNKATVHNYDDIPDLTMRNVHENFDRSGQIGNQQINKATSYNYNDIPGLTMRNVHEKFDRTGQMGNQQLNKASVYNYNDIPDLTMRNIHDRTDRAGQLGNLQYDKAKSYNMNDIPNMTQKEMYIKMDRTGNIKNTQIDKGYAFDFINNIPEMTIREIQSKNGYVNPVKLNEQMPSRADVNNMNIDVMKERILHNRKPTTSSCNKGPTFDFTEMNQKAVTQIDRELFPQYNSQNNFQIPSNIVSTRLPNQLPEIPCRYNTFVEENLKNNPYINNIVHQSYYHG
jgi:hypothetical protein